RVWLWPPSVSSFAAAARASQHGFGAPPEHLTPLSRRVPATPKPTCHGESPAPRGRFFLSRRRGGLSHRRARENGNVMVERSTTVSRRGSTARLGELPHMRSLLALLLLLVSTAACTDAGVYALQGSGVPGPDRTAFEGDVCVPVATGDTFPVK